jgi:predicted MFS family arabinose efflux permease
MTRGLIVALLCLAEVCTMVGVSTWPALLPGLQAEWHINNTVAGTISGAFFAGYMAAVPVLVSLTDRWPARDVYVGSCVLLTAGSLALARADAPPLAMAGQAMLGAGLAGTYMPGLKELSDRITGLRQARAIAFYTSTYGIGTSVSLYLAGAIASRAGWRVACAAGAAGPPVAAALMLMLPGRPRASDNASWPEPDRRVATPPRFSSVLANRRVRTYVLGYSAHCCELFALRSWIVAFFTFAGSGARVAPSTSAALLNLLGPPASITGNEIASRGRLRTIGVTMGVSGALALSTGAAGMIGGVAVIATAAFYVLAIMADSAALTAGLVEATDPSARGTAMAVYSFFGFAGGLVGPVIFGALLDAGGGTTRVSAWLLAFGGIACISLAASATLLGAARRGA